LLLFARR
ncbi:putative DNA transformation protein, partial [Vibrio parahaemolyticus AQ3810]